MTTQALMPAAIKTVIDAMDAEKKPAAVEVFVRKSKDIDSEIDSALARLGLCIFVLPVKPGRAMPGADFPFYEDSEIRIRVLDMPAMNDLEDLDGAEMAARIALELTGTNPGDLFADVLRLSRDPVQELGVYDEETDRLSILHDVVFSAPYQLHEVIEEPEP